MTATEQTRLVYEEGQAPADIPDAGQYAKGSAHACAGHPPFRPPGAPAGVWPFMPWWHQCFHDPYERINVWSHGVPAALFGLAALAGLLGVLPLSWPFICFFLGSTAVHVFSTLAHVWPESLFWEKLDHLGIVTSAYSTLATAVWATDPTVDMRGFAVAGVALLVAAFLPKKPRILGIATCVFYMVGTHWRVMNTPIMIAEICLYACAGLAFWHNAGHDRPQGFTDHHLLHYFGTAGTILHIFFLLNAEATARGAQLPTGYGVVGEWWAHNVGVGGRPWVDGMGVSMADVWRPCGLGELEQPCAPAPSAAYVDAAFLAPQMPALGQFGEEKTLKVLLGDEVLLEVPRLEASQVRQLAAALMGLAEKLP